MQEILIGVIIVVAVAVDRWRHARETRRMGSSRFGAPGAGRSPVSSSATARVDASAFGSDWDERFLGSDGLLRLEAWARERAASLPRRSERLGPCIPRPSKIVCIGLNYADHARETGAKIPDEPIIFFKATTALCGPNDDLVLPRGSVKTLPTGRSSSRW